MRWQCLYLLVTHNGSGQHIYGVARDRLQIYLKVYLFFFFFLHRHALDLLTCFYRQCNYVGLGFYTLASGLIKAAMLLQLMRITMSGRALHITLRLCLSLNILWCLAYSTIAWIPCIPIAKSWDGTKEGYCWGFGAASSNLREFWITLVTHAVTNTAGDGVILGLASLIMWHKKSEKGVKFRISCLLFLGSM